MKRITKLTSLEQQQHQHAAEQQQQSSREFATVEEMLRYDSAHTPVPPAVVERLQRSVNQTQTPGPARSWWQRFFGTSNE